MAVASEDSQLITPAFEVRNCAFRNALILLEFSQSFTIRSNIDLDLSCLCGSSHNHDLDLAYSIKSKKKYVNMLI